MSDSEEYQEFQWTFSINDVVKFEETTITVYAETYEQAIRKVKKLKLPSLRTFDDVEENLKLTNVYEVHPYYDTSSEAESIEKDDD
jgi:hypothetical protein